MTKKAITFALSISPDVIGLHVDCEWTEQLKKEWQDFVEKPVQEIGLPTPRLGNLAISLPLSSPVRSWITCWACRRRIRRARSRC